MIVATEVVSFREDTDALEYLRGKGINPNEFAREAFEAYLRQVQVREKMDALEKAKVRLPRSIEEIIREDRDSH